MDELESKLNQIRNLLSERGLDGVILQKYSSVAWATCGAATYVNSAAERSSATLLITRTEQYLVTNNIESPRLQAEEVLEGQGWQFHVNPWHGGDALAALVQGLRLGSDGWYPQTEDLSADLVRLRLTLHPAEIGRFRSLCQDAAGAMDCTIRSLQPGISEFQIAGRLADEVLQTGALAIVNLIATDERIFRFRHPLPTGKRLERYAMLVLCARRGGLICSLTRLIHFGPLPGEIARKAEAVAAVDAAYIAATRPGVSLAEILRCGQEKYAEVGFPDEWRLHHQGGPTAYLPREVLATPQAQLAAGPSQAYAWNPSIAGVKSEDTILVAEEENEVLTSIPGWPEYSVTVGDFTFPRPAILVMD